MTTVHALIVEYPEKVDAAPTLTQSADRALIEKTIRQGGQRVWLDIVDPDAEVQSWAAALLRVPGVLFDLNGPISAEEPNSPVLHLCGTDGEASLAIAGREGTLLTVRRGTIGDNTFNQAAQGVPIWKDNFNPALTELAAEIKAAADKAVSEMESHFHALRVEWITHLHALRDWREEAEALSEQLIESGGALNQLATWPSLQADPDAHWRIRASGAEVRRDGQILRRMFDNSDELPTVVVGRLLWLVAALLAILIALVALGLVLFFRLR